IIVVEDLISTGGSSIEVVEILRKEGHNILGVIAVFDYGFEKARENFRKIQCNYFSLSNYNTLIQEARVSDYITKEEEAILTSWNQNPENWYTQNFQ
nr:orotate phosphoribosyltransferase [Saprospiraceae bacterium]